MNDQTPLSTMNPDELHALVDGRLSPAEAAAMELRLASDPEATATVAAWRAQRKGLCTLHRDMLDESVPASFMAAAQQVALAHARQGQWRRWAGVAASIMLAFGMGWVGNSAWHDYRGAGSPLAATGPVRSFARQASLAHSVYLPEVRHPVEVAAAQQEHLVQWLSKRLGRPLKVPVLAAQGWDLVGGRLLPGEDGARAQFMYQNSAGERITLYLGAVKAGALASSKETAFRFLDDGPVPGFYWVDQGFGYALAGKLPRQTLLDLATAAYAQL